MLNPRLHNPARNGVVGLGRNWGIEVEGGGFRVEPAEGGGGFEGGDGFDADDTGVIG